MRTSRERNARRVERARCAFSCRRVSNLCHNDDASRARVSALTCAYARPTRCERRESNPHVRRHRDLNPARLPFRHARVQRTVAVVRYPAGARAPGTRRWPRRRQRSRPADDAPAGPARLPARPRRRAGRRDLAGDALPLPLEPAVLHRQPGARRLPRRRRLLRALGLPHHDPAAPGARRPRVASACGASTRAARCGCCPRSAC